MRSKAANIDVLMRYYIRDIPDSDIKGPLARTEISAWVAKGWASSDGFATNALGKSIEQVEKSYPDGWYPIAKLDELEAAKSTTDEVVNKLVSCPMCEKQISPEAPACPQCGHPMKVLQTTNDQIEQVKRTNYWLKIIGVALLIILFKFVFRLF